MRSDKTEAIKLRLEGKSYGEICRILNISSKGTLSVWFRDLKLSEKATERLKHNQELATKRGLHKFNKDRTARITAENTSVFEEGRKMVGSVNNREVLLMATALYWGEGTKSIGDGRSITLAFTNSDPLMIQFYVKFLREILKVKEEKIRGQIFFHENISADKARAYWQKITKISPNALSCTKATSKASKGRRSVRSLPHGTLQIRVHDRKLFYKVMGLIEGISNSY